MDSAAALHPCGVADADQPVLKLLRVSELLCPFPPAHALARPEDRPVLPSLTLPSSAFDERVKADTDGFFAGVRRRVKLDPADPLPPRMSI